MNILITGGSSGLGKSITECLTMAYPQSTVYFTYNSSFQAAIEIEKQFNNTKAFALNFKEEKSVQNITQNLSKTATLTTKAKAGDIIEYTLTTHNSYGYDRSSYAISDAIGDVLEYTDIDPLNLASSGGSYDANTRTITWANQTIKANSELTKQFRVTVKNPVPSTNKPGVMTTSYDCVISNVYGNETSVPINCPVVKTAEYVTTRMPDTGPGTSVMIGAVFMIVVAYFFARARLLGKEIELVRTEYAAGGGF